MGTIIIASMTLSVISVKWLHFHSEVVDVLNVYFSQVYDANEEIIMAKRKEYTGDIDIVALMQNLENCEKMMMTLQTTCNDNKMKEVCMCAVLLVR